MSSERMVMEHTTATALRPSDWLRSANRIANTDYRHCWTMNRLVDGCGQF